MRALRAGTDAGERREALRVAADLYGLLRSYCRRIGRLDLSLVVADRALRAAEEADDPLRIAAAQWNLGHVLLSQPGREEEAACVAMDASRDLATVVESPAVAAVRGALELVVVVADARGRRPWAARDRLTAGAVPLARRSGESNVLWTVFGPTNVALHALSVEMTAGDAVEGLRLADEIDVSSLPSQAGRRPDAPGPAHLPAAGHWHCRTPPPGLNPAPGLFPVRGAGRSLRPGLPAGPAVRSSASPSNRERPRDHGQQQ